MNVWGLLLRAGPNHGSQPSSRPAIPRKTGEDILERSKKGDMGLSREQNQRRLDAYHTHDTDEEAAEVLGIPARAFRTWRRLRDLPLKGALPKAQREREQRVMKQEEDSIRLAAYTTSSSDKEAARKARTSIVSFARWRHDHNLPAHNLPDPRWGRAGRPPKHLRPRS